MDIKKFIDGKKVIFKSTKNTPSINTIKNVYNKIPDDKRIPIVFETKNQYVTEYVRNQEKARGKPFPKKDIQIFKHKELNNMSNVVSRYTTKHNPFMEPRTVFFTDYKLSPTQFKKSALHEYGHEAWENNKGLRNDWKNIHTTPPTKYGKTDKQEDFAESYMLYKQGLLKDNSRSNIIQQDVIGRSRQTTLKGLAIRDMINNVTGKNEKKGLRQVNENHGMQEFFDDRPRPDNDSGDNVADALGWNIPEPYLATTSWKTYGLPKNYSTSKESTDLKGNITQITGEHYNALGNTPNAYNMIMRNRMMQDTNNQLTSDQYAVNLSLIEAAQAVGKGLGTAKKRVIQAYGTQPSIITGEMPSTQEKKPGILKRTYTGVVEGVKESYNTAMTPAPRRYNYPQVYTGDGYIPPPEPTITRSQHNF